MPLHSFYLAPEAWRPPYTLDPGESHHLARVVRIKAGAEVRLFDGQGRHGLFRVDLADKNAARLSLLSEAFDQAPATRCTLAAGFSKALRRGWFMEKTVELEAFAVWFWQGDYSQASLPDEEKQSWKAALLAGAKQCGSAHIPGLSMLHGGVHALAERRGDFDRAFMLYEGDTGGRLLGREDLAFKGDILLIVGPEGGFSPAEAHTLTKAGCEAVSLGNRVLRWETAAILTLGLAWWARQGQ
ncbi:16S rRNA (uracil(1498)-N(3))-methyltransferase [Desulfovibrio sp. OttesenSCG-928-M14]|nr:16S rRNA (uracil(1498)-N(3))-methyltransferase [Desulfovibrio sp. OttesenSCG-928-M14]